MIKCGVLSCKHNDDCKCCLKQIEVCSCNGCKCCKENTMCNSYDKK